MLDYVGIINISIIIIISVVCGILSWRGFSNARRAESGDGVWGLRGALDGVSCCILGVFSTANGRQVLSPNPPFQYATVLAHSPF